MLETDLRVLLKRQADASTVAALFSRQTNNKREKATSADLRNTLLPKLLSDQLRIAEAGHQREFMPREKLNFSA
ncbi:MAG: hypothetical protein CME36_00520 [unclassified Hahellaceae]|nr:hypothetical protein [Hahellaceae bacterium]